MLSYLNLSGGDQCPIDHLDCGLSISKLPLVSQLLSR